MLQESETLDGDADEEGDYKVKLFQKYSEEEIGDDGLSTNSK